MLCFIEARERIAHVTANFIVCNINDLTKKNIELI